MEEPSDLSCSVSTLLPFSACGCVKSEKLSSDEVEFLLSKTAQMEAAPDGYIVAGKSAKVDGTYSLASNSLVNGAPTWEKPPPDPMVLYTNKNGRWAITMPKRVQSNRAYMVVSEPHNGRFPHEMVWGIVKDGEWSQLNDVNVVEEPSVDQMTLSSAVEDQIERGSRCRGKERGHLAPSTSPPGSGLAGMRRVNFDAQSKPQQVSDQTDWCDFSLAPPVALAGKGNDAASSHKSIPDDVTAAGASDPMHASVEDWSVPSVPKEQKPFKGNSLPMPIV